MEIRIMNIGNGMSPFRVSDHSAFGDRVVGTLETKTQEITEIVNQRAAQQDELGQEAENQKSEGGIFGAIGGVIAAVAAAVMAVVAAIPLVPAILRAVGLSIGDKSSAVDNGALSS
jgi:hypothetical protein